MTRDEARAALLAGETINWGDGIHSSELADDGGTVYSNCPDGCCADRQTIDEFLDDIAKGLPRFTIDRSP